MGMKSCVDAVIYQVLSHLVVDEFDTTISLKHFDFCGVLIFD